MPPKKINLHEFVPRSRANGPGERAVVWVQGCPHHCKGCFNPGSWAFVTKKLVTVDELESRILAIQGIDGITFSGGEPFAQARALAELAKRLRQKGLTVVCYTGYTLTQLKAANRDDWNSLLEQIDLLIDGRFVQKLKCNEPYRGSSNQQLHYLSGRIQPEQVQKSAQTAEFTLSVDGQVTQTGFPELPDLDAVMSEVQEILQKDNGGD